MTDSEFEKLKKEVEELEDFINELIEEKPVKYKVTRPIKSGDGAYLRIDKAEVTEEQLLNTLTLMMKEPWFHKVTVERIDY